LKALCGGEALPLNLAQNLVHRCGSVWNMYGPTETTIWSSMWKLEPGLKTVLIGRPIANTQMYILDRSFRPVPIGVGGELCIGGDGVARGYLNRPNLTQEKFIPDPFSTEPGSRLYRTGDLARYLPDGQIEFLGRLDHQVKIRGYRIELGEIETLLAQHPAVHDAVVVARDDATQQKQLVAYLIAADPANTPSTANLRSYLRIALPDYMVPAIFVFMDAFPLTPNKKVDRKALPAPVAERANLADSDSGQLTPTEAQLKQIWEDLLGIKPIGIHDNFFDIGGHSLLAVRVLVKIREAFGRTANMPLNIFFQDATIELIASEIDRQTEELPWATLTPIQPDGTKQPFFCVHGLTGDVFWFNELS
jgi:hypothetical protein